MQGGKRHRPLPSLRSLTADGGEGVSMLDFTYFTPTRVVFGPGKLAALETLPLPGRRPLLVCGAENSQRRNGALDRALALLRRNGCAPLLFEKARPHPEAATVNEGAELACREGCDFVLGLGGGGVIDTAKAIAAAATNSGGVWEYVNGGSGGARRLKNPVLPVVAVPTTAGTGAETDSWCVIGRPETREKIAWRHEALFPVCAVVDPELTATVPPELTALTGMAAFFHSVGVFLDACRHPVGELLAVESVRTVAQFLPRAVQDGGDREARARMAWAGTAAGLCASCAGCIVHHAMGYALCAFHPELPHGAALVLLSGPFFERVARQQPERCVRPASAMGVDVTETLPARRPALFVQRLREFIRTVGLADVRAATYGLTPDMAPALAVNALRVLEGAFSGMSPMSAADMEDMYRRALTL